MDHLEAADRRAVPTAVLADEGAVAIALGQLVAGVEEQAQRGHVGTQRVVGDDGLRHQVGTLRLHPRIQVLAEVAVGPAVEAALPYRGQVVRDQVVADLVALVDDGPQLAGDRFPLQAGRVAQAGGVDAAAAAGDVHLENRRATVFDRRAVLGDVAVRTDAHVELAPVGTGEQRLGPVVVDGVRQVGELHPQVGDPGFTRHVAVAHDIPGIGDIQVIPHPLHAKRRVQPFQEHVLLPLASGVGSAQQGDAVAALAGLAGLPLDHPRDELLRRGHRRGAGRVGLHHQHIAVGQDQQLARVLQAIGDLLDLQALGHRRLGLSRPAHAFRYLHRRQKEVLRFRKRRIGAGLLLRIVLRPLVAAGQDQAEGKRDRAQRVEASHAPPPPRIPPGAPLPAPAAAPSRSTAIARPASPHRRRGCARRH